MKVQSRIICSLGLLALMVVTATSAKAQFPEPDGGNIERGVLPRQWMTGGPKCMEIPEWQVHEYNPNFYILRQSGCSDYEKPFVYLLFGKERGLVFDTGSRGGNFAPNLQHVVKNWLLRNHRESIPLVILHSHSHSDHVAGDADIQALKDPAMPIAFVAAKVEDTKAFYKIAKLASRHWPDRSGRPGHRCDPNSWTRYRQHGSI